MIGIIYKLTIVAKYRMDGYKPFYIGQHWCKSKNDFLDINYPYYGSGSIWNDFLKGIKKDYPNKWRHFIRKEILCIVKEDNQKILDKLEKFYINKYHSLYYEKLGGCNILNGTANNFGSGSPAKDPIVKKKISNAVKEWYQTENGKNFCKTLSISKTGHKLSEREREKRKQSAPRGENGYWYGKKLSEETKNKIRQKALDRYSGKDGKIWKKRVSNRKYPRGIEHPNYGKKMSESSKEKMKETLRGSFWVNNGVTNLYLKKGSEIPSGYKLGLLRKTV